MSGSSFYSGHLTNEGKKELDIRPFLNLKIDSISLYIMPIALDIFNDVIKSFGVILTPFLPISPTMSHVAVQLNMENSDLLLIEYGQYLTKDSEKKSYGIFSPSNNIQSSNEPRKKDFNDVKYYYINKDGLRISKLDTKFGGNIKDLTVEIATKYYGISLNEFNRIQKCLTSANKFTAIYCDIKNKITLQELFYHFKGKKEWEAQGYNVVTHNCQDFGAEIIKILKAVRTSEHLKVRMREKYLFPSCIIHAFWKNEEWSTTNTLGRIPVLGFIFDIGQVIGENL